VASPRAEDRVRPNRRAWARRAAEHPRVPRVLRTPEASKTPEVPRKPEASTRPEVLRKPEASLWTESWQVPAHRTGQAPSRPEASRSAEGRTHPSHQPWAWPPAERPRVPEAWPWTESWQVPAYRTGQAPSRPEASRSAEGRTHPSHQPWARRAAEHPRTPEASKTPEVLRKPGASWQVPAHRTGQVPLRPEASSWAGGRSRRGRRVSGRGWWRSVGWGRAWRVVRVCRACPPGPWRWCRRRLGWWPGRRSPWTCRAR